MGVTLRFEGDVAVITWDDGENRFNSKSLAQLNEALDVLDGVEGPLAVVVTGTGKYFSNGLDLERFAERPEEFGPVLEGMQRLFGRILDFPAFTVGALNGHAFAGGAMFACTFDYRVMRDDRGYWCINEVELGLPLNDAMAALIMGRLPTTTAREAMLTARRYDAAAALAGGIVDEITSEGEVLELAIARATSAATKSREVMAIHKNQLMGPVARQFTAPR